MFPSLRRNSVSGSPELRRAAVLTAIERRWDMAVSLSEVRGLLEDELAVAVRLADGGCMHLTPAGKAWLRGYRAASKHQDSE